MKILIIRLSSLGDIILTEPIVRYLRESYPRAEIDYVTKPQFTELVKLMGHDLSPIAYEKTAAFHLQLGKKGYDLVLDLHGKLSSYLLRIFARGKRSALYFKDRRTRKKIVRGNKSLAITSTVDLYNSALNKLGLDAKPGMPKISPPEGISFDHLPKMAKRILIFPGALHETKRYPAAYYKQLIRMSPADYQFIILGSPAERELAASITEDERTIDLCGQLSLLELAAIIDTADWVISSDSGPMHIAAALKKKQIAIFGATHPRLGFAPQNPLAKLLVANLPCQPCSLHGGAQCPKKHFNCMHKIKISSILDIITKD
ncbi:MAG: glycosyltransferase family 9 protein [Candidatus Cloacimonetes bacterium]|nr:glycosyltransferase family 9 protein [Candidatus Cloacimonadota bacterium]